ncbi:cytochrome c1 [Qipengyuania oceanensis]|uniref:Cytochrome c1 n=1 Tax=Qipengyuania oceanensis TaxID=1463597 RepID=A0A844YGU8_9SPHN|nr:cytochrome c1 [Qipengyuania oceanensis]MXO63167.1 cytochrome c1 [Qipengyuania oceanensis]
MIRIISALVGLGFTVVVVFAFFTGLTTVISDGELKPETAEHEFHKHPKEVSFAQDGLFGKYDRAQLQRGLQVYKEVCSACHSLKYVAFRDLSALGYTEGQVKALSAQFQVPGIDSNTGEATTRPGTPTDYFPSPYPNNVAAAAANNNAIPPDLSLMTKARHDGTAYVYSLLTGYQEPSAELVKKFPASAPGPGLHHNPYFANLNLAMAPPLTSNGQVTYAPGNPEPTIDQMAKDVSAFLAWTAEPKLEKRRQTGWAVLGFLIFATILAYLSKKQIWSAVKPRRED